MEGNFASGIDY